MSILSRGECNHECDREHLLEPESELSKKVIKELEKACVRIANKFNLNHGTAIQSTATDDVMIGALNFVFKKPDVKAKKTKRKKR